MRKMLTTLAIVLVAVSMLLVLSSHSTASTGKSVVILNLHEAIDAGSDQFLAGSLSALTSSTTAAVIIDMNTPGGILENMLDMVSAINATESRGIPVFTYIPADSNGASAGSYIAMASTGIYMGPGSYIGPSTPIVVGGTALEQNHTESAMASLMASMAQAHGRNVSAVLNMVYEDVAYTASEAMSYGVITGLSNNLTDLMGTLNLTLYHPYTLNPSFYDNFLSFLSNTTVDGIMILIGAIAILADLYHGTVALSVIGIIFIGLGLVGAELVSASLIGIIILLMGAVLIFLEAKTGHGIALVSGVAVSLVGTFMLASPYLSSNPGYSPSPIGTDFYLAAVLVAILAVIVGLLIRRIAISLKASKYTGAEALIGKTALVKKQLNPQGWVSYEGIQWEARSVDGTSIEEGQKVIIVARDGLTLLVKKQ
ncbi:MAG: nodulation protein NfeD [Candidatus Thermoplasmatota archaeon]|nr:nodulation protein NfeD [Candidatus Thermoplasmatota archaeon]